jgi:hypothetical protein
VDKTRERNAFARNAQLGAMTRLGMWSALTLFLVGVAYAVALAIGVASAGPTNPIVGPVLAVMEFLTLLSAPFIVIMMAAVQSFAAPRYKIHGSVALAFAILVAGLTSAVHFVSLTALRQLGSAGLQWPSASYALELLAWDVFLGLSLIFAAPVFQGDGLKRAVRVALRAAGGLSLAGTVGPAIGDLRLQRIGVLGYGAVLPVACLMLAVVFRRASSDNSGHTD